MPLIKKDTHILLWVCPFMSSLNKLPIPLFAPQLVCVSVSLSLCIPCPDSSGWVEQEPGLDKAFLVSRSEGEYARLNHQGSAREGKGGGAYSNQDSYLDGQHSCLPLCLSRDSSSAPVLSWAGMPIRPGSLVNSPWLSPQSRASHI